jgi:hypothetical protein
LFGAARGDQPGTFYDAAERRLWRIADAEQRMNMSGLIAKTELTTLERCEWLLTALVCNAVGQKPQRCIPWLKKETYGR